MNENYLDPEGDDLDDYYDDEDYDNEYNDEVDEQDLVSLEMLTGLSNDMLQRIAEEEEEGEGLVGR